ncbi:unnamed protein product, partial [Symbiodinium sp. KB8]
EAEDSAALREFIAKEGMLDFVAEDCADNWRFAVSVAGDEAGEEGNSDDDGAEGKEGKEENDKAQLRLRCAVLGAATVVTQKFPDDHIVKDWGSRLLQFGRHVLKAMTMTASELEALV